MRWLKLLDPVGIAFGIDNSLEPKVYCHHYAMELTLPRRNALAAVSRDIAQVFFASIFIGPLIAGESNLFLMIGGLALSLMAWYLSLILIEH